MRRRWWRLLEQPRGQLRDGVDHGTAHPAAPTLIRAAYRVWHASRPREPQGRWDAIVVAGARVRPDGTATPALRRRVERGVELYRAGIAPKLVMSGRGEGPRPEAEVMAALGVELGLDLGAVILEDRSMTTRENASCTAALGLGSRVVVVSCPAHIHRCQRLFGAHFAEVFGAPAHPGPLRNRWRLYLREAAIATIQG